MVSPCLRKCKNTRENSRGTWPSVAKDSSMLEETDSEFVMVVALLPFQGWYLSDKRTPDLLANVTATNDALNDALPC